MKRKVIPVLIGLLLIVLILAGAAGVFLFQRYSGSEGRSGFKRIFRAEPVHRRSRLSGIRS